SRAGDGRFTFIAERKSIRRAALFAIVSGLAAVVAGAGLLAVPDFAGLASCASREETAGMVHRRRISARSASGNFQPDGDDMGPPERNGQLANMALGGRTAWRKNLAGC